MQDDVSRLVGIEGLVVTGVDDVGACLLLGVELRRARRAVAAWCGRASLAVKERPVVRVRDLPIAGRVTYLLWRKRRFGCEACGRTFTESHQALPPRQRVSARFRARLFERSRGGGAHAEVAREEHTTRYQVARARERFACLSPRRPGCLVRRPSTRSVCAVTQVAGSGRHRAVCGDARSDRGDFRLSQSQNATL